MIRFPFILVLCAAPLLAFAQESPVASAAATPEKPKPVKPTIEKLAETRYRIGNVIFDHKSREIRLPAKVEITNGLLEFLFVLQQGKIHETLFIADIVPTHLNLALTLLRYQVSNQWTALQDALASAAGKSPDAPALAKDRSSMSIDVEWKDAEGTLARVPVNEWIIHSEKSTLMPPGPWVYTGSAVSEGQYVPDVTGDVAAIFNAEEAMINYPGNDHESDLVWFANTERVPPQGTPVTLIITPWTKTMPKPVEPAAAAH